MSQANREDGNLPERTGGAEGRAEGPSRSGDRPGGAKGEGQEREKDLAAAPQKAGEDDPRHDPMAPPAEPCECFCLHCGRTYMSDRMWFQKVKGARDGFPGFWMCPTPNCDGAGFTFDIFPTDPNHPANDGWHYDDGEEGEEGEEGEWEEGDDEEVAWDEEGAGAGVAKPSGESDESEELEEWDPDESKYKAMDEWDEEDDDLDGEEWKLGLQPGERPPVQAPPPGVAPRNQEEQEALYNEPDRRPRELDWSDREDRPTRGKPGEAGESIDEDDIPF